MCSELDDIEHGDGTSYGLFINKIKGVIRYSTNGHEHIAYELICDLEDLVRCHVISRFEFAMIVGKAVDVLAYFRCDYKALEQEDEWYRAALIHQMGCGMLQALYMMRPELQGNPSTRETAYYLYMEPRYLNVSAEVVEHSRPVKGKYWLAVSHA
jgi:hypothetical protein